MFNWRKKKNKKRTIIIQDLHKKMLEKFNIFVLVMLICNRKQKRKRKQKTKFTVLSNLKSNDTRS